MPVSDQSIPSVIKDWLYKIVFYNKKDIVKLLKDLSIILFCVVILTYSWEVGWEGSLTRNIMYILEDFIPGAPGPLFVGPLSFLIGLISLFAFDAYKRLQGLILLIPGIIAMLFMIFFFDRLQEIPLNSLTVLSLLLGFIFGLLWGGVYDWFAQDTKPKMDQGFQRLTAIVGILGLLGVIEASFDYQSPIILDRENPTHIGNNSIPASFTSDGFLASIEISPVLGVIALLSLGVLLSTLLEFTKYEMDKDVLILGPDRAGKTWLMGGAGYCLRERSLSDVKFQNPEINPPLQNYVNPFIHTNFDANVLEATDDYSFLKFKYEHGLLPKRQLAVKTVDYSGEHLVDINVSDPWNEFNDKWADKERITAGEVPSFQDLAYLDDKGKIDDDDIPPLLSAMVDEADSLGLVFPADELATVLDDDELPDHIDRSWINDQTGGRAVSLVNYNNNKPPGYAQIYRDILEKHADKNIFFAITKTDILLESFEQCYGPKYMDPKGNQSWESFRNHIRDKMVEKNEKGKGIDFLQKPMAKKTKNYYPMYFEPSGDTTNNGDPKPKLDCNSDDYYPFRGLKHLLKRMGR